MNRKHLLATMALGLCFAIPAAAQGQGKVTIAAPLDGATLDSMGDNHLVYEVEPGPRGDHVHVYADDQEIGILRKLKGSHSLTGLSMGKHAICIKVVNKAHVPVGIEQCVQVSVK